jgi:hypothetical protein
MGTQQMMELLLKEIRAGQEEMRTNQAKTEAERKADQAKIEAGHKEFLAKLDADRKTSHKELLAIMEADRKERRVGQEILREKIET